MRRFDVNMDLATFEDSKADIWAYMTSKYIRIVDAGSATRRERAKETEYWREYQRCYGLFGERQGVVPVKQTCAEWEPLLKQASGCLASAWARLAADIGDANATRILEDTWGCKMPGKARQAGLLQKARFAHVSCI